MGGMESPTCHSKLRLFLGTIIIPNLIISKTGEHTQHRQLGQKYISIE